MEKEIRDVMNAEMPQIAMYISHSSSFDPLHNYYLPQKSVDMNPFGEQLQTPSANSNQIVNLGGGATKLKEILSRQQTHSAQGNLQVNPAKEAKKMESGRIVQVFIVDPDKNVPVEKRLLYKGEQQFTDMTDQDLFFDLDLKSKIASHNEYRATLVNKNKSTGTEKIFLEPLRISELKMIVSVAAEF